MINKYNSVLILVSHKQELYIELFRMNKNIEATLGQTQDKVEFYLQVRVYIFVAI